MDAKVIEQINRIVATHRGEDGSLIQILLDIQKKYNWISPEFIRILSEKLDIPVTRIYRVASFYKALSLSPRGKHIVKVCLGTACHVRGGVGVMERMNQIMKITEGNTTKDSTFTLERVNCLGCCALGPIITVDDDYYGKISPETVNEILESYLE